MTPSHEHDPRAPSSAEADGAMRRRRRQGLLVLLAVVVLAGCYGWMKLQPRTLPTEVAVASGEKITSGTQAAMPSAAVDAAGQPMNEPGDTTPDLKSVIPPGSEPGVGEVIARLRAAGVTTGIAAFNPPGTSPPLVGIAVPADFPLPPGYVRHGQTTDDGQPIEPILMFSPDFDFFDASGQPIAVPENRVVPPQYAPPGLPIRMIRIPPPQ